jgi:hypothetical protein
MIFSQSPPKLEITNGSWEFGDAYLLDSKTLSHAFIVKNTRDTPLTLTQIKVGCPCLVASTRQKLPLRLAPQGTAEIVLTVLLDAIPPSQLDKTVLVYAGEEVVGRLIVKGTIVPMVTITPAPLALGNIPAGTSPAFPLRITQHPRLQNARIPRLLSSSPSVVVENEVVRVAESAPIGPLSGSIRFEVSESDKSPLAAIWRGASITFFGEVKGDIAAEPSTVHFGLVRTTMPVVREVQLRENMPSALKNSKITSESALVKTEWQEKPQILRLALLPNIPKGSFQTHVAIETEKGQKLLIAITAYKA